MCLTMSKTQVGNSSCTLSMMFLMPHLDSSPKQDWNTLPLSHLLSGHLGKASTVQPPPPRQALTQLLAPGRYTCYDLGESILVGGGDRESGAADGGQADMEKVIHLLLNSF